MKEDEVEERNKVEKKERKSSKSDTRERKM